jgi:hypothetical protein
MLRRCGVAFQVTSKARLRLSHANVCFHDPVFGQDLEADSIGTPHDAQPPCPLAPDDERPMKSADDRLRCDEGIRAGRREDRSGTLKDFIIDVICHRLPRVRSRLAVSGKLPERT